MLCAGFGMKVSSTPCLGRHIYEFERSRCNPILASQDDRSGEYVGRPFQGTETQKHTLFAAQNLMRNTLRTQAGVLSRERRACRLVPFVFVLPEVMMMDAWTAWASTLPSKRQKLKKMWRNHFIAP